MRGTYHYTHVLPRTLLGRLRNSLRAHHTTLVLPKSLNDPLTMHILHFVCMSIFNCAHNGSNEGHLSIHQNCLSHSMTPSLCIYCIYPSPCGIHVGHLSLHKYCIGHSLTRITMYNVECFKDYLPGAHEPPCTISENCVHEHF